MENRAFSAGPADSPRSEASQAPGPPPLEMKTQRPSEEKQPLSRCNDHCTCSESVGQSAAGRAPNVTVKAWSRTKTVVMVVGIVALVVWCGVMAAMYHFGVL